MSTPYTPSTGTEGADFMESWCAHCARDKAWREGVPIDDCDDDELCEIIADSFCKQVPEWVQDENGPRCTAFVRAGDRISIRDVLTIDMFEARGSNGLHP